MAAQYLQFIMTACCENKMCTSVMWEKEFWITYLVTWDLINPAFKKLPWPIIRIQLKDEYT